MTWPVLCALALAVSLYGEGAGNAYARGLGKGAASLAFIAYGVSEGLAASTFGVLVLVALVLSTVGDLALLRTEKPWFLGGLVAFLFAHVAYAVGFVVLGLDGTATLATVPVIAGFVVVIWRWLSPHTGSLRPAVAAYVAVISAMVVLSAGASVANDRWSLGVAAVVFMVSDLFVARQRFVHPGSINRFVGLPLYYAAQLGFVWAAAGV
jgi:uncharacterized membrane protein YhhN